MSMTGQHLEDLKKQINNKCGTLHDFACMFHKFITHQPTLNKVCQIGFKYIFACYIQPQSQPPTHIICPFVLKLVLRFEISLKVLFIHYVIKIVGEGGADVEIVVDPGSLTPRNYLSWQK